MIDSDILTEALQELKSIIRNSYLGINPIFDQEFYASLEIKTGNKNLGKMCEGIVKVTKIKISQ